jgi:hypothetical protein
VAFGAAMVSVGNYYNPGGRIDTFWGPAPFVLGLAAVLAAAAAAMVRRGRAGVLAVVEVRS